MSIKKDEETLLLAINLQCKMIVELVKTIRINKLKKQVLRCLMLIFISLN